MKPPSLFDSSTVRPPELTVGESRKLKALLEDESWETAKKLWDWAASNMNLALITAKDNHAFHQGRIIGFAMARDLIFQFAHQEAVEETKWQETEDEFFKKVSSELTTTGY